LKLFLTYCSGSKDESLIGTGESVTPDKMYTSDRIQKFINTCKDAGACWAIFSDEYGIWFPNEEHEWYEKPPEEVTKSEFNQLVVSSAKRLNKYNVYFFNPVKENLDKIYLNLIEELKNRCVNISVFNDCGDIKLLNIKDEEYNPSSSVLFLTICSFAKNTEGFPYFNKKDQIYSSIGSNFHNPLQEKRNLILNYLHSRKIEFQKGDLKSHDYNKQLVPAQDFGSNERGHYLPAIWRYDGRFFQGLGAFGKRSLLSSNQHFLIISGLYGLLTPLEPIQCYSVPISRGDIVQTEWINEKFLSKVLVNYVKTHSIKKLFDFTGVEHYRDLIDWEFIKTEINSDEREVEVLHSFSTLGAGDNALRSFGEIISDHLSLYSEEELLQILPESQIGSVYFRAINAPWEKMPTGSVPRDSVKLKLEDIDNEYTRRIFESAENEFHIFSVNDYNPEDSGSTLLWHYAKGVEVMLHSACTMKIKRCIAGKGRIKSNYGYNDDLKLVKKIISASSETNDQNQLSLGEWSYLHDKILRFNNPVVHQVRACIQNLFGDDFHTIYNTCNMLKDFRNPATHRKIYTFEEAKEKRNKIVAQINRLTQILFRSSKRVQILSQSKNVLDRREAIVMMAGINENWCKGKILEFLNDKDNKVKKSAIEALGKISDESVIPILKRYTDSPDKGLMYASNVAIRKIQERISLSK